MRDEQIFYLDMRRSQEECRQDTGTGIPLLRTHHLSWAYYGGYGYPAYSYSAPYATSYGTGYGYGSYYGGYGYPGYSSAPYNPGPSFGFGWRY